MNVSSASTSQPDPRPAATRDRLLASASALFAEFGLHRVTSHDIAHHAGMAAGTFYLHFRDKAEAYRQILASAVAELRSGVQAAVSAAEGPEATLRARSRAVVSFAQRRGDICRILFHRDSEAAEIDADVLGEFAAGMAEALRRSQVKGDLAADLKPTVLAQALLGMTMRLIDWWMQNPDAATDDEIVETLMHIQARGILREPAPTQP